ncbi:MAG: hypothetical protein R3E68_01210 [Burkholderiaceae bacterium]
MAKAELSSLMNSRQGSTSSWSTSKSLNCRRCRPTWKKPRTWRWCSARELREEDYRKRISVNDARRALVSVLPGLSFDAGCWQYDSNRYLYNNSLGPGGPAGVSADLFRLASIPSLGRARDAQLDVDDICRMAQAMGRAHAGPSGRAAL